MATYRSDPERVRTVQVTPAASDDEAAAIAAAIEQALADADEETEEDASVDPWIRAGRFDAVRAFRGRPSPDAPPDPWMAMGRVRR